MPKGMIDSLTLNEQCFSYDHDEKTKDQVGASHQISVHFGKTVSEKKIFRNRPI
jgi:hypothetical protein